MYASDEKNTKYRYYKSLNIHKPLVNVKNNFNHVSKQTKTVNSTL